MPNGILALKAHARMPGFRPGKAPQSMLKGRSQKEIREEVLEQPYGNHLMVVRVGERISAEQALKLESIYAARSGVNRLFMGIGKLGHSLVLFYFPYRFALKNIRKFNPSNKDLFFLALLTLFNFLLMKTALVMSRRFMFSASVGRAARAG